jgi:hypothetical protein
MSPHHGFQTLRQLIDDFVDELTGAIESQATSRARDVVEAALAAAPLGSRRGRPGRPAAALLLATAEDAKSITPRRPRKKPPIQLCPVPGCDGRAAPIFGMVCSSHKDLPKAKIKQYREARRAAKQKGGSAPVTASPAGRGRKPRATAVRASARRAASPPARAIKAAAQPKKRAATQPKAKLNARAKPTVRSQAQPKPQPALQQKRAAAPKKPAPSLQAPSPVPPAPQQAADTASV